VVELSLYVSKLFFRKSKPARAVLQQLQLFSFPFCGTEILLYTFIYKPVK